MAPAFRAALRENRLGFIRISKVIRKRLPDEERLLRSAMMVIAEERSDEPLEQDLLIYRGYSPQFSALPLGASPSEYMAVFTRLPANPPRTPALSLRLMPV